MLSPVVEADEEENEEEESGNEEEENEEEENEEGQGNGEDGGETSGSSTTLLDSSSDESIEDEIANGNRVKNAAEMDTMRENVIIYFKCECRMNILMMKTSGEKITLS
ncbi:prothymosin alpha [Arabidopsis lyrata subsp. lyrata]|uniref:prothymosin alpha n=1 Tax=Arabidopsis lyrata subsp. lyrata TaxID=81972 RepID=UPI000A29C0B9|nr:prothymosin alpha [Arabidopsis lyrata subsp. lyrata]|eukprot:XP_020875661.1 prothymosin alpha [Arabidopsis lyrata subsp. lyrata]